MTRNRSHITALAGLALFCVTVLLSGAARANIIWRGNFEMGTLGWRAPGRDHFKLVTSPVRDGKHAAQIDMAKGETGESGRLRVELSYLPDPNSVVGADRYFGWSVMIDAMRPLGKGYHEIGFWEDSPIYRQSLHFVYDGTTVRFGNEVAGRNFWSGTVTPGRWYDFIVHVKWSSSASVGFVELWFDGNQVVKKTMTPTMHGGATHNFFQFGLWRNNEASGAAETIYLDAAVMATTLDDVQNWFAAAPAGGTDGGVPDAMTDAVIDAMTVPEGGNGDGDAGGTAGGGGEGGGGAGGGSGAGGVPPHEPPAVTTPDGQSGGSGCNFSDHGGRSGIILGFVALAWVMVHRGRIFVALLLFLGCAGGVQSEGAQGGRGGIGSGAGDASGGAAGRSGGAGGRSDGSTGGDGGSTDPVIAVPPGKLVISEIMYHPVAEDSDQEDHEFVEIHNQSGKAISLARWKIEGTVRYEFPAGSSIEAGQYLVVAKRRDALVAVTNYGLAAASVVGNYDGQLDNGGGRIALLDADGALIDTVTYQDGFPWPLAADALGAGEAWLPAALLPVAQHRYMGVSLERVSFDVPANEVSNWTPSPVDGATPGKPNKASGTPLPVVENLLAGGEGQPAGPIIRASDKVVISAAFSKRGSISAVQVEYFVDDAQKAGEPVMPAAMTATGGVYAAALPPHADNSIVRYRIVGDRGNGREIISPRPSDPYGWYTYFVSPAIATKAPVYQVFISSANWGKMWTNLQAGPLAGPVIHPSVDPWPPKGCALNAGWDKKVAAVFVHEGVVYDVMVQYQGGRWNRVKGQKIAAWPYPGPTAGPSPLLSLSWDVHFPRYKRFEGVSQIILNKLNQACPGVDALVETRLMAKAGIPVQAIKFARLHVNGGYYNYMMRLEAINDDMARRFEGKGKPIGDMFKANASSLDEGNIAAASNGDLITLRCPAFNLEQKYQGTYPRKAPDWKGGKNDELVKMIVDLQAARAGGRDTVRAFLAQNFDVNLMLTEYAIRNWAGAVDDILHNFFPYRHPDGKWIILPQDLDNDWGSNMVNSSLVLPATTFYEGEEGDLQLQSPPKAPSQWFNHFKDSFQKNYRAEFDQRLKELDKTILQPDAVSQLVDEAAAEFSLTDWNQAPAAKACNVPARIEQVRKWARDRHAVLVQRLGS